MSPLFDATPLDLGGNVLGQRDLFPCFNPELEAFATR
jgi:hypothetical protein